MTHAGPSPSLPVRVQSPKRSNSIGNKGARLYEQERRRLAEALEKMRDDDRAGA